MSCLTPLFSRKKRSTGTSSNKKEVVSTEPKDPCFPLLDLPSSLLIEVLRCLPARDVLKSGASCHLLQELSKHNYIWRKLAGDEWGTHASTALMRPERWNHYFAQRSIVSREGAFQWEDEPPSGEPMTKRYQHTGSSIGDDVYFIGGQELPDRRFDDIFVFHTKTNRVAKVNVTGSMPKFARHSAVPIGKKIFLFGGFDGVSQHFHLSVFDTENGSWKNPYVTGECPPSRTNHAATSIGDKMYLFGGMYKDSRDRLVFLNDLYEFDSVNYSWRKLAQSGDIPDARCGHRLLSLNGTLVLFGGGSGEQWDKKYSDVHVYNPATGMWTRPKVEGSAPVCTFTIAFIAASFLFVFGGQSLIDNNLTNNLFCLDLTSMEWIKIAAAGTIPSARDMASGNVVGSAMYMFGGYCGAAIDSFHTLKISPKFSRYDACVGVPHYSMRPEL